MENVNGFGTNRLAPLLAIRGECGLAPANSRHKANIIFLWNRLIKMDNDRVIKQARFHPGWKLKQLEGMKPSAEIYL